MALRRRLGRVLQLGRHCVFGLIVLYKLITFFVLCLWYNQRIIVYPHGFAFTSFGFNNLVRKPSVPHAMATLVTKDKVRLQCLVIPHSSSTSLRGTAILFHGSLMNTGEIIDSHAVTLSELGFTVLSAEYRGYGYSEGTPSESGLRIDAQAALDFVLNHPNLANSPIIICGHALGGAVAIDLASRNADKISALIIENTFCSIPSLVRKWRMGRFLSLLTTQKWYSASKIAELPDNLPILMLSGLRDRFFPPSEMVQLWEVAKTRPKKKAKQKDEDEGLLKTRPEMDVFETFRYGGHFDTYLQPGYWARITRFLDNVVPSSLIPSSAS